MTRFQSRTTSFQGPMDNDMLRAAAPSIFALEPWQAMSHKYAFVPTIDVVEAMRREGFQPVKAMQSSSRTEGKADFTKHLLRLRHVDARPMVNDVYPEIVLINSHDGTSAYQMHAGLFRLVCANGMVVADSTFSKLSLRHSGDIANEVIAAAFSVAEAIPQLQERVERFRTIELHPDERRVFAQAALQVRYPDKDDKPTSPITVEQLLRPRRSEDNKGDLFTVLNTCQEALLKGGVRGISATLTPGQPRRRHTTREVKSVSGDISLNKALWTLAERMAELKAA